MATILFEDEVENAVATLRSGGVILYPTDTIWGIGCDATDKVAVQKIYTLKQRPDTKSMIILVAEERDIMQYVAAPDPHVFDFIEAQQKPTTIIFEGALNLPANLVAEDDSIAIRLVKDPFCRHLIKRLRKPIVSTSANISGTASPQNFSAVEETIKQKVDYVVQWRQGEMAPAQPSQIVKWIPGKEPLIIRP